MGTSTAHDRPAGRGQSRDRLAVDGDPEGHPSGGLVVADLELEPVEEFPLDIFGQPAKIGFNDGQPVK